MSPTIYDIARVQAYQDPPYSRVLNKQTNISPEARKKCYGPLKNYSISQTSWPAR